MSSFGTSSPPPLLQVPPFVSNSIEFLRHFILFLLLPIFTVILLAFVSAAIARYIYKKIFARYATPQELLEDALKQLKDNNKSWSRDKALDKLRLVIRLQPPEKAFRGNDDMIMKPYIILANELFYGYIQDGHSKTERRRIKENNTTRKRRGTTQQQCIDSLTLIECQDIIQQGLDINPQNDSLLKLQSEVQLIKQYGMNESHIKMLNAGYMGTIVPS